RQSREARARKSTSDQLIEIRATPRQTSNTPAQRAGVTCSFRRNFAPNAPATKLRAVAGTTRLTSAHESKASNEKEPVAIKAMPIHSQTIWNVRARNLKIAEGVIGETCPICFIA